VKSAGQGWLLVVAGVDDVGVLGLEDGDADVEGTLLLAPMSEDETEEPTSTEVDASPLDELVHAAHSINPAAVTPANARRGRANITAPHWA